MAPAPLHQRKLLHLFFHLKLSVHAVSSSIVLHKLPKNIMVALKCTAIIVLSAIF